MSLLGIRFRSFLYGGLKNEAFSMVYVCTLVLLAFDGRWRFRARLGLTRFLPSFYDAGVFASRCGGGGGGGYLYAIYFFSCG